MQLPDAKTLNKNGTFLIKLGAAQLIGYVLGYWTYVIWTGLTFEIPNQSKGEWLPKVTFSVGRTPNRFALIWLAGQRAKKHHSETFHTLSRCPPRLMILPVPHKRRSFLKE